MNHQSQTNLKSSGIDINDLPCPAFCKDKNFNYFNVNKAHLNFTGCDLNEVMEHSDYDLPWEKYANTYRDIDKQVLNGRSFAVLESIITKKNAEITIVTRKNAITNLAGVVTGILGLITTVSDKKIIQSTKLLNRADKELTAQTSLTPGKYNLSKREQECLFYVLREKTAKQIAKILGLSFRTVEFYIENIKNKYLFSINNS